MQCVVVSEFTFSFNSINDIYEADSVTLFESNSSYIQAAIEKFMCADHEMIIKLQKKNSSFSLKVNSETTHTRE